MINRYLGWAFLIGALIAAYTEAPNITPWAMLIIAKLCWIHEDIQAGRGGEHP